MGSGEHYRHLPVPLSEEQKAQRTQELIRRLDIMEDIEDRRKASNDEYKSQIKREAVNCGQLRRDLKQGYTSEEVKCDEIMDWDNGTVRVVRLDTDETVSEREITESERQMRLEEQAEKEEGPITEEEAEAHAEAEQQAFTKGEASKVKDEETEIDT